MHAAAAATFAVDVRTLENALGQPGQYTARLSRFIKHLRQVDEWEHGMGDDEEPPELDPDVAEAAERDFAELTALASALVSGPAVPAKETAAAAGTLQEEEVESSASLLTEAQDQGAASWAEAVGPTVTTADVGRQPMPAAPESEPSSHGEHTEGVRLPAPAVATVESTSDTLESCSASRCRPTLLLYYPDPAGSLAAHRLEEPPRSLWGHQGKL